MTRGSSDFLPSLEEEKSRTDVRYLLVKSQHRYGWSLYIEDGPLVAFLDLQTVEEHRYPESNCERWVGEWVNRHTNGAGAIIDVLVTPDGRGHRNILPAW